MSTPTAPESRALLPHEWHAVGNIPACRFCRRAKHLVRPRPRDECPARLRAALGAALEREEGLRGLLALDQPFTLLDVLDRLADAADHLLGEHSCDAHGYELTIDCAKRARVYAARLRAALSPDAKEPE